MILLFVVAAMSLADPQERTDTTIAVRPGMRLDLNNHGGSVSIRTWQRNAMRVTADHGSRDEIDVQVSRDVVTIKSHSRRGGPAIVNYEIVVPATTPVSVSGPFTDITIDGVQADISAETVEGGVSVRGGSGYVSVRSVEGEIVVDGAKGRVTASGVEGDVRLTRIVGEIVAESVDGDIYLEQIVSTSVEATTVDGNIVYHGSIDDQGRYRFAAHDGDLDITVPAAMNATVSVATFEGDFDPDFPVTITAGRTGRRFTFTVGTGRARLELETFDGSIRLRRDGDSPRR